MNATGFFLKVHEFACDMSNIFRIQQEHYNRILWYGQQFRMLEERPFRILRESYFQVSYVTGPTYSPVTAATFLHVTESTLSLENSKCSQVTGTMYSTASQFVGITYNVTKRGTQ